MINRVVRLANACRSTTLCGAVADETKMEKADVLSRMAGKMWDFAFRDSPAGAKGV